MALVTAMGALELRIDPATKLDDVCRLMDLE